MENNKNLIEWLSKQIIWDNTIVKLSTDNKIILESYDDWKIEENLVYEIENLNDLTNFINEITNSYYEKRWCENLYVIKGVWHKLNCEDNYLNTVWRLLFEIQSWYTENKQEEISNIEFMIKNLEKYKEKCK